MTTHRPENHPLACTLDAAQMRARGGWLKELARGRVSSRPTADGIVVAYRNRPGVESQLRELAAAEAACCPFLELEVRPAGEVVELRVSGAPGARPIIEEMFGARAPDATRP